MQLHQPEILNQIEAQNARYWVISFAPLERFSVWPEYWRTNFLEPRYSKTAVTEQNPFRLTTFLHDPSLEVYRLYGLGRLSMLEVYGPEVLWKYARWTLEGRKIQPFKEDPQQRGGNFVVSGVQKILFSHSGRNQLDRPQPLQILKALKNR